MESNSAKDGSLLFFGLKRERVRQAPVKPGTFNQTAYRILYLLKWLSEQPLTFNEINERFLKMPDIGKTVSQDTLWLYLNTLKALDCDIGRPTSRNGYRYGLSYQPFGYMLQPSDIDILQSVLYSLDDRIDYRDVAEFHQWLAKVFDHTANPDRLTLRRQFFDAVRLPMPDTLAAREMAERVALLEMACRRHQLLQVTYNSVELETPQLRQIIILPQNLFQNQGLLYLLGHVEDRKDSCMLRLDRMTSVHPYSDEGLRGRLLQRQLQRQWFLLRIFHCGKSAYEPLGEEDDVIMDPHDARHLVVRFRADNEFMLTQKLLASGYRFQVLYPAAFRKTVVSELHAMRRSYV